MQNRVIINHQPIVLKEYEGKRVVTFKDIDNVHARPSGTARKRFNDNKRYFIEGEDYFVRKTDEARNEYNIAAPNGLTLITETGYLMLVKSFTDDLAWDVQRQLVKAYFRAQENEKQTPKDFTPKYYNGIPVMTVHDIEAVSGVNGYSIRLYIQKLAKGTDYYFLEGQELARFKSQNPSIEKLISCLLIVTRPGFVKIMGALKVSKLPECFNQALPEPNKYKKPLSVDIPDNAKFQRSIRDAKMKATGLLVLLDQMNMYANEEEHIGICKTIEMLGARLSIECCEFKRIKYGYATNIQ